MNIFFKYFKSGIFKLFVNSRSKKGDRDDKTILSLMSPQTHINYRNGNGLIRSPIRGEMQKCRGRDGTV